MIVEGRILQQGAAGPARRAGRRLRRELHRREPSHGTARPGLDGLTEVVLDDAGLAYSTDEGGGRVGLAVYPWEIRPH